MLIVTAIISWTLQKRRRRQDTRQCFQIDKEILNANGSAVDAAIAAMFCLGVRYRHAFVGARKGWGNAGVQASRKPVSSTQRIPAPTLAYSDMFKDKEMKVQKDVLFRFVFSEDFYLKVKEII